MDANDGAVRAQEPTPWLLLCCTARSVRRCLMAYQFARRRDGQLSAGNPRVRDVDGARQAVAGTARRGWDGTGARAGGFLHRARGIRTAMGTDRSRDYARDA